MTKLADSIFPLELQRIFVLIFWLVLSPSKDLSMDTSSFFIFDIGNGFWLMAMVSRPKIGSRCLSIPDNCHNPHNLGWCTFFKPAYLFPQRTRKGLLLGKFIQRITT